METPLLTTEQGKTLTLEPSVLSQECRKRLAAIRTSFPSFESFAKKCNPDTQLYFGANIKDTIMEDYSTLAMLDLAIGEYTSAKWLVILVNDLNKFAGSRSMDEAQAESLAYLMAQECKDVKYSVVQLFFYRFKTGHLGRFYGKVDPLVITSALQDFLEECESLRQKYLEEDYRLRKEQENKIMALIYNTEYKWSQCQKELVQGCGESEGRQMFCKIGFHSMDPYCNKIILSVTREDYQKIEGTFFGYFSKIYRKFFPYTKLEYVLCKYDENN